MWLGPRSGPLSCSITGDAMLKWYLVFKKDGSRVETLAPHHMSIKNADKNHENLFVRLMKDEDTYDERARYALKVREGRTKKSKRIK